MQDIKETEFDRQMAEESPVPVPEKSGDTGAKQDEDAILDPEEKADAVVQRKGFSFLYLFAFFYALFPYISLLLIWFDKLVFVPNFKWTYLVILIINIIVAVRYSKPENRRQLFNAVMWMKFMLVPFYIIGGFFLLVMFSMTLPTVILFAWFGLPGTVAGIVFGWVILACQSPYMIAYLRLAAKEKKFIKVTHFVHVLLQFFFVFDIVDAFVLAVMEKWWKVYTILLWIGVAVVSGVACVLMMVNFFV